MALKVKIMPSADRDPDKIFLIGAGGFLGTICKFLLCESVEAQLDTLSVNVLGNFMLGSFMLGNFMLGLISYDTE